MQRLSGSTSFAVQGGVLTPHLVLAIFLVAQAYDGLFTYVVVEAYGVFAEGNMLLATWIELVGAGPAIFGAKLMAASCGVVLHCLGVQRALLGLTVFYAIAAIARGSSIVLATSKLCGRTDPANLSTVLACKNE